jgi:hypothetical protein
VGRPLPGEVAAAKQRHGEAAATEHHHEKAAAGKVAGAKHCHGEALRLGGVGTPPRETQEEEAAVAGD